MIDALSTRGGTLGPAIGRPAVLMTCDEARWRLGRSAVVCLREAVCAPHLLCAMLWGVRIDGLDRRDLELARAHKQTLEAVEAAGHGSIIGEELEGICSATGIDEDRLENVDLIAQVFASDPTDF